MCRSREKRLSLRSGESVITTTGSFVLMIRHLSHKHEARISLVERQGPLRCMFCQVKGGRRCALLPEKHKLIAQIC